MLSKASNCGVHVPDPRLAERTTLANVLCYLGFRLQAIERIQSGFL